MAAYYNEIDPYAAQWLRHLIAMELLPDGEVDTRSIVDVRPSDLAGFDQCHFFAGIGGWAYAARLAGWPDDRPLWTGSCPCQPFSVAGKGAGKDDPRHLWPHFLRLIAACRPPVVMGEQVSGKSGYDWFDGVVADLAGEGYAGRGVDIPACAVDAPHIRQRLYWIAVADAHDDRRESLEAPRLHADRERGDDADGRGGHGDVGDARSAGLPSSEREVLRGEGRRGEGRAASEPSGAYRDLADPARTLPHGAGGTRSGRAEHSDGSGLGLADAGHVGEFGRGETSGREKGLDAGAESRGRRNGTFWSDAVWLPGKDGKTRRAQPGVPLLAHGVPARVGKLRALGNAIVPQLAAEVIRAFAETMLKTETLST